MRIVLDSNVLIASLISRGLCHQLVEHCFVNHTVVGSEFILDEVRRNLIRKFKYAEQTADEAVSLFRSSMNLVAPVDLAFSASRDPDDDNILAAAIAGGCDCIITGVGVLLDLKKFEGIGILTPREFSDWEGS